MSDQELPANVRPLFKVAKLSPTAEVRKLLQSIIDDIDKGMAPDRCVVLMRINHADRRGYTQSTNVASGDADFASIYEVLGFLEVAKLTEFDRAYTGEHHSEDERNEPVAETPPEEPPKKEE